MSKHYDFSEKDIVYLMKDDNIILKDKKYLVHKIEIIEGGNFLDGWTEEHSAYLEDIDTQIIERKNIAFINQMCGIKNIYAIKCIS
jgi:hypothetical protein